MIIPVLPSLSAALFARGVTYSMIVREPLLMESMRARAIPFIHAVLFFPPFQAGGFRLSLPIRRGSLICELLARAWCQRILLIDDDVIKKHCSVVMFLPGEIN